MITAAIDSESITNVLTISAKGWVVIPAQMRKKYGLYPGVSVAIVDYGDVLALVPLLADPIQEARGLLAGATSLTQALLENARRSAGVENDSPATYVLDSFAVLAYLENEAGAAIVQGILATAAVDEAILYMSAISLGEMMYIIERERGLPAAQIALAQLQQLPIQLLEATLARILAAAHIKAHHALSYQMRLS